jgi:hypothetical protein
MTQRRPKATDNEFRIDEAFDKSVANNFEPVTVSADTASAKNPTTQAAANPFPLVQCVFF